MEQSAALERDVMKRAILTLLDSLTSNATVLILSDNCMVGHFHFPAKADGHTQLPQTACGEDILLILGEAQRRLTTPEILKALEERKLFHGETTVKVTLSRLVKEGRVDNRSDVFPRGYAALGGSGVA
jgi:hypothetical protein